MSNACSFKPGQVELVDGTMVSSTSPRWLAQCEAVTVLGFSEASKARFFEVATRKRGPDAIDRLKGLMMDVEHLHILDNFHNREARRAYLDRVESRQGPRARKALEDKITVLWKKRQAIANA